VVFGLFVFLVVSVVQVLTASETSQDPSAVGKAAAIVVMGDPPAGSSVSADMQSRLEQALVLFQAGRAPVVVVTGGPLPGGHGTEALIEANYLEGQGLASAHIVQLAATNDSTALSGVATLYGHPSPQAIIIVSDPLDGLRLRATASTDGLKPEMSPATPPKRSFWTDVGSVWRQAVAVSEGRVFGFSNTGWASN
ncbi:MAG TPA: YdcF family protein, partial [Acidimicrobiales bacterium]|nr:YdcF family protein [Acidimicrobiales bacterium]